MEHRLTPAVFSGSAISALVGLLFGVLLHIPWEKRPGGPQILFAAAEAAERAHPTVADQPADATASLPIEAADLDTGYSPPNPLPVTRLHPEMFEVQPAAAEEAERQDADGLAADVAPPPEPD